LAANYLGTPAHQFGNFSIVGWSPTLIKKIDFGEFLAPLAGILTNLAACSPSVPMIGALLARVVLHQQLSKMDFLESF
jgi:hypothetical protein